jgi:hypothetical protein
METKVFVFEDGDFKTYNAFMVNRALSLHQDLVLYAHEMNRNSDLPKAAQYKYLLSSIRARRRPFVPWPKKAKNEVLENVMKYFNYNEAKALSALEILTVEQVEEIMLIYKHVS